MKIKRYLAANIQEGYERIKSDLGNDAVIISTKKVRVEGLKGLFGAKKVEIVAALENNHEQREQSFQPQMQKQSESRSVLEDELADVRRMLKRLVSESSENQAGAISKWKEILTRAEVNSSIIDELMYDISSNYDTKTESEEFVREALVSRLAGIFDEIRIQPFETNIFTLIGPTGVGKTTTLAKLAARHSLKYGKKIGLITIDTYRIGAVEQLKTYGDILDVDVEVVMTPEELKNAVDKHRDKDSIFIDTAGRASTDSMRLSEMRNFLSVIKPVEVFLVLSCTTKDSDLQRIAKDYSILDYSQLIFTKTDETKSLGTIVNLAHSIKKPVAYLTTGQNIPDDIEIVDSYKLAKLILEEVG